MTYVQPSNDGDFSAMVAHKAVANATRGQYRRMSHRLIGMLKKRETQCQIRADRVHFGNLMRELAEQSFGWGILLFAIINMIPVPLGTNMILGIPLLIIGIQMLIGFEGVRLPGILANRTIPKSQMSRTIARMRPIFRRLERVSKERQIWVFLPKFRPVLGLVIVIMSLALAAPIPTSGWGPAFSMFTIGFGMIERDGLIVMVGMVASVISLTITASLVILTIIGYNTFIAL